MCIRDRYDLIHHGAGWGPYIFAHHVYWAWDLCYEADRLAQPLTTAGEELSHLDHDLDHDLCNLSVPGVKVSQVSFLQRRGSTKFSNSHSK